MSLQIADVSGGSDAAGLRGLAGGGVHLPGDSGYDEARTPWALAVDLRPAAVAYPETAAEVAALVRAAAAAGLRVAPLGTGHNAAPLGDLSGSVLIRTPRLGGIEIDPDRHRARVGAGVVWADVVDRAVEYGLTALHGSSRDTGVVGYSLGGGISWYGRSLGLASSSVTAVELVTADGALVRVDADHEPDLFWALRGGGAGNFGVVTALEFALYPIRTAYAGILAWDWQHAHRVLSRWASWALEAPDPVTTSWRILRYPPLPQIPEPFRGRDLVMIDGAVLGDDIEAVHIMAPLRELDPAIDTFAPIPVGSLTRLHMDPEAPVPGIGWGAGLAGLPPAGVDALIETAGPDSSTSLLLAAELRQLGGAIGRADPRGGALDRLTSQFVVIAGGLAPTPQSRRAIEADLSRVAAGVGPFLGRPYLNLAEQAVAPEAAFDSDTLARLQAVQTSVDPSGLFMANHEIRAAPRDCDWRMT